MNKLVTSLQVKYEAGLEEVFKGRSLQSTDLS